MKYKDMSFEAFKKLSCGLPSFADTEWGQLDKYCRLLQSEHQTMTPEELKEFEKSKEMDFLFHVWCDAAEYSLTPGKTKKELIDFLIKQYSSFIAAEHKLNFGDAITSGSGCPQTRKRVNQIIAVEFGDPIEDRREGKLNLTSVFTNIQEEWSIERSTVQEIDLRVMLPNVPVIYLEDIQVFHETICEEVGKMILQLTDKVLSQSVIDALQKTKKGPVSSLFKATEIKFTQMYELNYKHLLPSLTSSAVTTKGKKKASTKSKPPGSAVPKDDCSSTSNNSQQSQPLLPSKNNPSNTKSSKSARAKRPLRDTRSATGSIGNPPKKVVKCPCSDFETTESVPTKSSGRTVTGAIEVDSREDCGRILPKSKSEDSLHSFLEDFDSSVEVDARPNVAFLDDLVSEVLSRVKPSEDLTVRSDGSVPMEGCPSGSDADVGDVDKFDRARATIVITLEDGSRCHCDVPGNAMTCTLTVPLSNQKYCVVTLPLKENSINCDVKVEVNEIKFSSPLRDF